MCSMLRRGDSHPDPAGLRRTPSRRGPHHARMLHGSGAQKPAVRFALACTVICNAAGARAPHSIHERPSTIWLARMLLAMHADLQRCYRAADWPLPAGGRAPPRPAAPRGSRVHVPLPESPRKQASYCDELVFVIVLYNRAPCCTRKCKMKQ